MNNENEDIRSHIFTCPGPAGVVGTRHLAYEPLCVCMRVSLQLSSSCLCGPLLSYCRPSLWWLYHFTPPSAVSRGPTLFMPSVPHSLSSVFLIIDFKCVALSHLGLDFTGLLASSDTARVVCSADARHTCAHQTSATATGCVALGAHSTFLAVSSLLKDMTHSIP